MTKIIIFVLKLTIKFIFAYGNIALLERTL